MKHLITIKFESTGYTPRLYSCTHSAQQVENLANQVWNSVGGCSFPFNRGLGCERVIRPDEILVLRELFMHKANWVKARNTPEEFEEIMKNDRTFLELVEIGTRWDTDTSIAILFDLAQIADPTIDYEQMQNVQEISFF